MKEREFAYRIRQHLNLGVDGMDRATADRLAQARLKALEHQKAAAGQLSLAGVGARIADAIAPNARNLVGILIVALGVAGWHYWTQYQDLERAAELEEIDSALLTDELPINAYLDRGFHAWLEQRQL